MKQFSAFVLAVLAAGFCLTACGASVPRTPTPANPAAVASPTVIAEPSNTPDVSSFPGAPMSFDRLSLVIPPGVATGGSGMLVPEAKGETVAPWDFAPEHIQFKLEGYPLEGKFHQPQIYVYPAQAYAQIQEFGLAAQSLQRLQALLAQPSMVDDKQLPAVPFFNISPALAAQVKVIPFQSGQGVRMLTQYAMARVIINNNELFYHFEGLTGDGQYYVVAILPIIAPGLPADGQPGSAVPDGGVPVPDFNDMNANWMGYFGDVRHMLQGLEPAALSPILDQLDALIASLTIATSER